MRAVIDADNWKYFIREAAKKLDLEGDEVYIDLENELFRSDHLREELQIVITAVKMSIVTNMKILRD